MIDADFVLHYACMCMYAGHYDNTILEIVYMHSYTKEEGEII